MLPASSVCKPAAMRARAILPVLAAALASAVVVFGALALAGAAGAGKGNGGAHEATGGKGGKRKGVARVATSGNYSERIKKLPITKREGQEKRVVMSLGPKRLPGLSRGDKVRFSSEVQFTLNCPERIPRCIGPPYTYDPKVKVELELTKSAKAKEGMRLGVQKATCQQRRPREHHCVLVIRKAGLRINRPAKLPCPLARCYVNLVVSASNPAAGRKDRLIVGGNKPDGSIPQDRGRINAVLFHPAKASYARPRVTRSRVTRELPLDFKRHVVYSQKLRNVKAGQQFAVDAKVVNDRAGLPYSVRTSSQIVLADSRDGVLPGPLSSRIGGGGEFDESNGFNCTEDRSRCTTRKVGVLRASRSAKRGGKPRPLFVNLVMVVGPKRLKAGEGDRYGVLRGGRLAVTRYPKPKR